MSDPINENQPVEWLNNAKEIKEFREKVLKENDNKCELSGEEVKRPCLDHDHVSGQCRGVISQHFNTYEGRVLKYWKKYCEHKSDLTLPQFLRKLADYYEKDWTDRPIHYRIVEDYKKQLKYKNKKQIESMLLTHFKYHAKTNMTRDQLIKKFVLLLKVNLDGQIARKRRNKK